MNRLSKVLSFATALLAVVVLVLNNNTPETTFFANDQSTDFIIAKLFSQGDYPLLGPPSHVGGRHPGPIYYWFVSSIAMVSGFNIYIANILFAFAKLLAIPLLAAIAYLLAPKKQKWLAAFGSVCCMLTPTYIHLFRMQWHSHYLILPSSLAFLSTLLFVKYGKAFFPLFLLGVSLLFQSHLSSVPVVAGLCLVAGLRLLFAKRFEFESIELKRKSLLFWLPVALLAVFWLPVFYHEVFYQSNFLNLFNVHSSAHKQTAGSIIAGSLVFEFIAELGLNALFSLTSPTWLDYIVFFIPFSIFLRFTWRLSPSGRWALLVILMPLVLQWLALRQFKVPLYIHYFNSAVVVPAVITGLIFSEAIDLAKCKSYLKRVLGLAFLVYFFLSITTAAQTSFSSAHRRKMQDYHSLTHVKELSALIKEDAGDEPFKIFTMMGAKLSRNGYFYFNEQKDYSLFEYNGFFHEIKAFEEVQEIETKQAYVIMCPIPFRRDQKNMLSSLEGWRSDRQLDLRRCKNCGSCVVYRVFAD